MLYIPVVFLTCLVFCKSCQVLMIADQGDLKSLAAINGIRDTWAPNDKASVFDAGKLLQFPKLGNEGFFVLIADIGAEFEKNCMRYELER